MITTQYRQPERRRDAPRLSALLFDDGSRRDLTGAEAEQVMVLIDEAPALTPNEAAKILGVSRPMVIRWIKDGVLSDTPVGSHHRIPVEAVVALKAERSRASREAAATVRAAATDLDAARRIAVARAAAAAQLADRDG